MLIFLMFEFKYKGNQNLKINNHFGNPPLSTKHLFIILGLELLNFLIEFESHILPI